MLERVGDAGNLLRYGAHRWTWITFGLICVSTGLDLWHGFGPKFGLGEAGGRVDRRAALGTLFLLLAAVLIEVLVGGSMTPRAASAGPGSRG